MHSRATSSQAAVAEAARAPDGSPSLASTTAHWTSWTSRTFPRRNFHANGLRAPSSYRQTQPTSEQPHVPTTVTHFIPSKFAGVCAKAHPPLVGGDIPGATGHPWHPHEPTIDGCRRSREGARPREPAIDGRRRSREGARPRESASTVVDVLERARGRDRRLSTSRAGARLRPTPTTRLDRLERSRACGRRPQSVLTVSSARALAADARKAS
jgi:hypothetical protein